jgi:hypothetical protein
MDDESEYLWLVLDAKQLAAECEFGQSTLIAAAVICLDRINDRLVEIEEELGNITYELEVHRGLHKDNAND